jgi:molybdopterin-binding protein
MNTLKGIIEDIATEGNLSLVKINPGIKSGDVITAIVIDTPETAAYLRNGNRVNAVFKETEVIIAKHFSGQISVRNRFLCTIKSVEKGKLLARITLDYAGIEMISIITLNAANSLELTAGDEVTALVKTNEISIVPHD